MTTKIKRRKDSGGPRRTCASCRKEAPKEELIRWVRGEDGKIFPDLAGRSFGRGAWTHGTPGCLSQLFRGLSRSFKAPVGGDLSEALSLLRQAAEHRVTLLLGALRRQRLGVYGTDAVSEAFWADRVFLLLVARDARASAEAPAVREAVVAGIAQVWGTKELFGRLFDRGEIGVIGVTDRGLAKSLFGAIAMALLVQNSPSSDSSEEQKSNGFGEVE